MPGVLGLLCLWWSFLTFPGHMGLESKFSGMELGAGDENARNHDPGFGAGWNNK